MNPFESLVDEEEELFPQSPDEAQVPLDTETLMALRAARDKDVSDANIFQGISNLGAAIGSQGRIKADPAVFDAIRKSAEIRAKEGGADVAAAQKAASDAVKAKISGDRFERGLKVREKQSNAMLELAKASAGRSDEQLRLAKEKAEREARKNTDIDQLPEPEQIIVREAAKKNAGKNLVAAQMEAALKDWDKLSPDQQVDRGRSLIKTLNSSEGADAVGVDEAKRIAGRLEFAFGNLNPKDPNFGRFQVGKDLPGFKEQVALTAKSLKEAVAAGDNQINSIYSKYGISRAPKAPGGGLTPEQRARLQELRAKRGQ